MTYEIKEALLRMETCAEAAIKNGIDRDTFWSEMLDTYGYVMASMSLDHYDAIVSFLEECMERR